MSQGTAFHDFAMVSSEDEVGVVEQAGGFQGVEQEAEVVVGAGDVLVVEFSAVDDFLRAGSCRRVDAGVYLGGRSCRF
jgi:hypothetical protein